MKPNKVTASVLEEYAELEHRGDKAYLLYQGREFDITSVLSKEFLKELPLEVVDVSIEIEASVHEGERHAGFSEGYFVDFERINLVAEAGEVDIDAWVDQNPDLSRRLQDAYVQYAQERNEAPDPDHGREEIDGASWQDQLPGGLGDKAKPSDVDPEQLKMGIKVELEHTKDKHLAKEIALDHLTEDPKYYSKLAKMESTSTVEAYRIIGDEPLGFAVGFKPNAPEFEYDRITVLEDNGGDYAYLVGDKLVLSPHDTLEGEHPEPDAMIFRSREDWSNWLADYLEGDV